MGVDYDATFGLGVKLNNSEIVAIAIKEMGGDFDGDSDDLSHGEAMEGLPEFPEIITWGQSGSSGYTDEEDTYYLFISHPFSDGIEGLPDKVNILYNYLKSAGFTDYSEVDVIGGVHCY